MASAQEAELDRLFQLPPAQLVEARDVLAAALKKAGEREAAAQIKALKRPTPTAFALNQVFFAQPALLERALAAAEQVRTLHAQDGVSPRALGSAVEAQRTATQAVVEAALKLAEAAGQPVGASQQRKVLTTLQGWLTGAGDQPPGRMTHDVEPSGFDAVVSVGKAAPRALPPQASAPAVAPVAPIKVDAERLRVAAELVAQRERQASDAHGKVSKQREGVAHEKRALTLAQTAVRDAERALDDLRDAQKKQEGNLRKAEAALAEAQAIAGRADEAAARARSERRALQDED